MRACRLGYGVSAPTICTTLVDHGPAALVLLLLLFFWGGRIVARHPHLNLRMVCTGRQKPLASCCLCPPLRAVFASKLKERLCALHLCCLGCPREVLFQRSRPVGLAGAHFYVIRDMRFSWAEQHIESALSALLQYVCGFELDVQHWHQLLYESSSIVLQRCPMRCFSMRGCEDPLLDIKGLVK